MRHADSAGAGLASVVLEAAVAGWRGSSWCVYIEATAGLCGSRVVLESLRVSHSFFEVKSEVSKDRSGTKQKRLLYFIQKLTPKEDKYLARSIMKFDII